jgi:hypothetical protein
MRRYYLPPDEITDRNECKDRGNCRDVENCCDQHSVHKKNGSSPVVKTEYYENPSRLVDRY